MTPNELHARCKEVVAKAKELYGIDMSGVQIGWCKGRTAGKAGGRKLRDTVMSNYYVKFNHDMLSREAADHVDKNTVPHEYAHILGFIDPERFGKGHDYLWQKTCMELGGSGATRHTEEVIFGTGTTYEYISDNGSKIRLSSKYHARVQRGDVLRYSKSGKGNVSISCAYSIVGHSGRTLAAPIVKKAVADVHPVQPVQRLVQVPVPTIDREAINAFMARVGTPVRTVVQKTASPVLSGGTTKADLARAAMAKGLASGYTYEQFIDAIMQVTGHPRQLSRSYYKGNYAKVGCPAP